MENYVYDIDSIRGLNLTLKIPLPIYSYLVEEIFKFTLGTYNTFSKQQFLQIFERESIDLKQSEQLFALNSQIYLVRFLQKYGIQYDNLNRWLKDNTLMPETHREFFVQEYQKNMNSDQIKKILSLGKLKELKWTINQYAGDAKYPKLTKIYILLEFNIQDESGDLHKQLINLTLQEFKVLQQEFKEIGEILRSFSQ